MIRILVWIFGCCALAVGASGSHASDTVFRDIARIEGAGHLRVAIPASARPPYIVDVVGQEPQGFDIWLANELAHALGVELIVDRSARTAADVITLVSRGEVDVGLGGIGVTLEAAKRVRFSRPYVREPATLLVNRQKALSLQGTCPSLDEAGELLAQDGVVALTKGSSAETAVGALFPDASPRLYDDEDREFAAVLSGDVIIGVFDEAGARYRLHQSPGARIRARLCLGGGAIHQIAIAVRPDAPNLRDWIDIFLQRNLLDLTAQELLEFGEREKLWP
jgi:polar amino acid transport system substrate-binding protein